MKFLSFISSYALWLLEHSYESGRAGSSMFFTHAFQFRPILERFDDYDGPRRLFNYVNIPNQNFLIFLSSFWLQILIMAVIFDF